MTCYEQGYVLTMRYCDSGFREFTSAGNVAMQTRARRDLLYNGRTVSHGLKMATAVYGCSAVVASCGAFLPSFRFVKSFQAKG